VLPPKSFGEGGKILAKILADEKLAVKPATAAKMLDMSRSSLYEKIQQGVIKAIKIGGCYRISLRELHRLLGETPEE
jgi:excisionase family DNA binding protein